MTLKIDLNNEEKRRNLFDPILVVLLMFVGSSAASFYAYGQTLELQIQRLDRERITYEEKIKEGQTIEKAIDKERQKLALLEQQLQLVRSLRRDPLKFAHLLAEVSMLLPDAVYLEGLNIESGPNSITLSGTAGGPTPLSTIASTLETLNGSSYFDAATLQTASRKGTDFSFAMTAHFDPIAAAEKVPGSKDNRLLQVTSL